MKIFKDKFMEWLDKELLNATNEIRYLTLKEVKNKLQEIIQEEFEKMMNDNNS